MNETAMKSGRLPNCTQMWSERVLKMVRVRGTSMETKENIDKTRRTVKRLLKVIISQLTPPPPPIWNLGGFTSLINPTKHNLLSKKSTMINSTLSIEPRNVDALQGGWYVDHI